jgi:hypothetical protein
MRRGPTDAGFRLAARVLSPRGSPRLVAFCAAVRPRCDPLHPGHSAARQAVRRTAGRLLRTLGHGDLEHTITEPRPDLGSVTVAGKPERAAEFPVGRSSRTGTPSAPRRSRRSPVIVKKSPSAATSIDVGSTPGRSATTVYRAGCSRTSTGGDHAPSPLTAANGSSDSARASRRASVLLNALTCTSSRGATVVQVLDVS